MSAADLVLPSPAEGSREVGARVRAARAVQTARYAHTACRTNAEADGEVLETCATPDAAGQQLLADAAVAMKLSARGYTRVLRVARTGNSMGWYSALACGGALSPEDGFRIANSMGSLMQQSLIGGQLVYPFLEEDWRANPARRAELFALIADIVERPDHALYLSINLGGMLVLAGNEAGLSAFEAAVSPINGRFPMRLGNHAAFHTPMVASVAEEGRHLLPPDLFGQPHLPLIDGRGAIWWPGATDTQSLYDYTLGTQVTETYDFTRAITIAAREFAPDLFIVTGPGTTLGGAVAQSLTLAGWRSMTSKAEFKARQEQTLLLFSLGIPEQRCF